MPSRAPRRRAPARAAAPGRKRAASVARARIRKARVGDLGWSFERQAVVYAKEFGYLPVFETYLAQGLAPYLEGFDDALDRLWIAELAGRRVGCIAIQHDAKRPGWAKLRWFLLERGARGEGLGRKLMQAALTFSRRAGYKGVYLWTVDDLEGARRVYERAGFNLAFEDPKPCAWAPWGHEQRWEIRLKPKRLAGRPETEVD